MSDSANSSEAEAPIDIMRLLSIVTVVASVLGLLISMMALIMIHEARSDVAELSGQTRKIQKALKTLAEDVNAMKAPPAVAAEIVAPPPPPVPTHVDAADPKSDCVVRSGDEKSLVGCIDLSQKKH